MIGSLISGDFLRIENPFSAAREYPLRCQFTRLSDRLQGTWRRTILSLPGAILAALLIRPIWKFAGVDNTLIDGAAFYLQFLPLAVVLLGLAFGVPLFLLRRRLVRRATAYHGGPAKLGNQPLPPV